MAKLNNNTVSKLNNNTAESVFTIVSQFAAAYLSEESLALKEEFKDKFSRAMAANWSVNNLVLENPRAEVIDMVFKGLNKRPTIPYVTIKGKLTVDAANALIDKLKADAPCTHITIRLECAMTDQVASSLKQLNEADRFAGFIYGQGITASNIKTLLGGDDGLQYTDVGFIEGLDRKIFLDQEVLRLFAQKNKDINVKRLYLDGDIEDRTKISLFSSRQATMNFLNTFKNRAARADLFVYVSGDPSKHCFKELLKFGSVDTLCFFGDVDLNAATTITQHFVNNPLIKANAVLGFKGVTDPNIIRSVRRTLSALKNRTKIKDLYLLNIVNLEVLDDALLLAHDQDEILIMTAGNYSSLQVTVDAVVSTDNLNVINEFIHHRNLSLTVSGWTIPENGESVLTYGKNLLIYDAQTGEITPYQPVVDVADDREEHVVLEGASVPVAGSQQPPQVPRAATVPLPRVQMNHSASLPADQGVLSPLQLDGLAEDAVYPARDQQYTGLIIDGNGTCAFNAIAVKLGLLIKQGHMDDLQDSDSMQNLLQHFARFHPKFVPATWDNLKAWLNAYTQTDKAWKGTHRDLEYLLGPVLRYWYTLHNLEEAAQEAILGHAARKIPQIHPLNWDNIQRFFSEVTPADQPWKQDMLGSLLGKELVGVWELLNNPAANIDVESEAVQQMAMDVLSQAYAQSPHEDAHQWICGQLGLGLYSETNAQDMAFNAILVEPVIDNPLHVAHLVHNGRVEGGHFDVRIEASLLDQEAAAFRNRDNPMLRHFVDDSEPVFDRSFCFPTPDELKGFVCPKVGRKPETKKWNSLDVRAGNGLSFKQFLRNLQLPAEKFPGWGIMSVDQRNAFLDLFNKFSSSKKEQSYMPFYRNACLHPLARKAGCDNSHKYWYRFHKEELEPGTEDHALGERITQDVGTFMRFESVNKDFRQWFEKNHVPEGADPVKFWLDQTAEEIEVYKEFPRNMMCKNGEPNAEDLDDGFYFYKKEDAIHVVVVSGYDIKTIDLSASLNKKQKALLDALPWSDDEQDVAYVEGVVDDALIEIIALKCNAFFAEYTTWMGIDVGIRQGIALFFKVHDCSPCHYFLSMDNDTQNNVLFEIATINSVDARFAKWICEYFNEHMKVSAREEELSEKGQVTAYDFWLGNKKHLVGIFTMWKELASNQFRNWLKQRWNARKEGYTVYDQVFALEDQQRGDLFVEFQQAQQVEQQRQMPQQPAPQANAVPSSRHNCNPGPSEPRRAAAQVQQQDINVPKNQLLILNGKKPAAGDLQGINAIRLRNFKTTQATQEALDVAYDKGVKNIIIDKGLNFQAAFGLLVFLGEHAHESFCIHINNDVQEIFQQHLVSALSPNSSLEITIGAVTETPGVQSRP